MLAEAIVCDRVARGESWGWFAPQYKILTEAFNEIRELLDPIVESSSKVEGAIHCLGGGRVDFWTLQDERAGRSRKYHGVIIDEAAFAGPNMESIWSKSIKPALLDYRGVGFALSTPSGKDDANWFHRICTDPTHGFVEFHAPSSANPYLPADELERLERENQPDVYRQEYLAEFVDWSGASFFSLDCLLIDGKPAPLPTKCEKVFAVIDCAVKTGTKNDATAAVFFSYNSLAKLPAPCVFILDWSIVQVEGASLEKWLPSIFTRLEELARECKAWRGSVGAFIEDASAGQILIQQSKRRGWPAHPIVGPLVQLGKDGRAFSASTYYYRGDIKITEPAFEKVVPLKNVSKNHLITQLTGFKIGAADGASDDLVDCVTYGLAMTRGTGSGPRLGI